MEPISEEELAGFSKLLEQEQQLIQKYKSYADSCDDPALRELCIHMAQRHKTHYEEISSEL